VDTKELMSGIAVVIDDQLPGATPPEGEPQDRIASIMKWFETEWDLPFVTMTKIPPEPHWPNLLRSASFVLLDWQLWGDGGDALKQDTINRIRKFLKSARNNLVPVFILTNESPDDVSAELEALPNGVYNKDAEESNFVFVKQKSDFWDGTSVNVDTLDGWVYGNASVYALKTWNRVMDDAKDELFGEMCRRSVHWPKVFWATYTKDEVDPSAALTNLINDSLGGRMRLDAFEDQHLADLHDEVPVEELRKLLVETSFRTNERLPADEVRCGDLYKDEEIGGKYWLNLRPDCDCIPRKNNDGTIVDVGDIEVYCVEGKKLTQNKLRRLFKNGHFQEYVSQCVVFGVAEGQKSILFNFSKLRVCKYSKVRAQRMGRLLHPYVTRVQQRYASFTQRQALPRIPDAAMP